MLTKGNKKYHLFTDDIIDVHRAISKKRPILPTYDCSTSDETCSEP